MAWIEKNCRNVDGDVEDDELDGNNEDLRNRCWWLWSWCSGL